MSANTEDTPMDYSGSKTILIVDDDSAIRRLTATLLERHGYTVIEAESGSQGLERFTQYRNEVSLILSDVVMPRMLGTKMIQLILALDPSVPVLLMTGYAADADLPQSVPVLSKPFTAAMLVQTVSVAIAGRLRGDATAYEAPPQVTPIACTVAYA